MSRIIATGSYLPGEAISNKQWIERWQIDSSDEWIRQRSGIAFRHMASMNDTLAMLATAAAKECIQSLSIDQIRQIKYIIVATMSSKGQTPCIACQVQDQLGATEAWAFDISGACTGFVMAMNLANQLSVQQTTGYTLVIGAEKMTQILDMTDRTTCVLFGDGAGAVLIEHDGKPLCDYQHRLQTIPDNQWAISTNQSDLLTMQGREVFNFVYRTVAADLKGFIRNLEASPDYLLSHQANRRLIELFIEEIDIDREKVPINIDSVANTSAASIPILLDQQIKNNKLALGSNAYIVMTGFGGGLSMGHIAFRLS